MLFRSVFCPTWSLCCAARNFSSAQRSFHHPWSDESLMACAQSYFSAYVPPPPSPSVVLSASFPSSLHLHSSHPSQPRVFPLPVRPIPKLHELSLWELVRLLKVMEDMSGVVGFPRLRVELLLRQAVKIISAVSWEAASPEDAAALHALAVHFADRAGGAGSGSGSSAELDVEAARADEFKRLQNACKQHLSPAIAGALDARVWPPVAVADIAHTLGPRKLLSTAAMSALVRYVVAAIAGTMGAREEAAAAGPPLGLEDFVDLLLGLAACTEIEGFAGGAEGVEEEGGGAVSGHSDLDAVLWGCAGLLAELLVAREKQWEAAAAAVDAAAASAAPNEATGAGAEAFLFLATSPPLAMTACPPSAAAPPIPLSTLSALALVISERFDGGGKHFLGAAPAAAPLDGLYALAHALGTCATARLRVHSFKAFERGDEQGITATAAQALCLGKSLAVMGVWHGPFVGLLGGEWLRRWGRAPVAGLLPPRTAADALFIASTCAARGFSPAFPPAPGRLYAEWNDGKKILFLLNGLGKGLHGRPMLPRPPFPPRPMDAAFARSFQSAWDECARGAATAGGGGGGGGGGGIADSAAIAHATLQHVCHAGAFVTPEGCLLDIAVPGASFGVRIVRSSDYRLGKAGLKASLLAEQCILEAAGWTVEYLLEPDLWAAGVGGGEAGGAPGKSSNHKAMQVIKRLLAAEVERKGTKAF